MQSVYMRLDIGPGLFQCSLNTWDQLASTLVINKVMTMASSWGWWTLSASSSVNVMACSSMFLILGDRPESWTFYTTLRYVFLDLENWPVELPPMITLISPSGSRDDSSTFPFNFSFLWSHPRKFLNFPCLMRFSICYFRLKHSSISCS